MLLRTIFILALLAGTTPAVENAPAVHGNKTITLPEVKVELAPGPGREKTAGYCTVCHSLDYITTQPPFSREKWGETVAKMIKVFGAPIPPDAAAEITAYLGAAYGPAKP